MSDEFVLRDGGEVGYVINFQPIRYKRYSPASQQYKSGVYGRYQVMNEYGGWVNADWLDSNKSLIVREKPDAHLIAAAPDLLEALEIAVADGAVGYLEWIDSAIEVINNAKQAGGDKS